MSEIGYARQIQFLADNNVDVPDEYLEKESFSTFLNSIFTCLKSDENYPFAFNSATLNIFIENVRNAFKASRDSFVGNVSMLHVQRPISSLRESLVYKNGEWVSSNGDYYAIFSEYNCYAFAIDRIDVNSEFLSTNKLNVGKLLDIDWSVSLGIVQTTQLVVNELQILGYQNVEYHTSIPSNLDGKDLICVRIGEYDFHFMKYDKIDKCWYHKPGNSAILKYMGNPSNDASWHHEYSINGTEYEYPEIYNSSIYYITYDTNDNNLNCSTIYDNACLLRLSENSKLDKVYELNVDCAKTYNFDFSGDNGYKINLFNCIGQTLYSITSSAIDGKNVITFDRYFNKGKYYIQVMPIDDNTEFTINSIIKPKYLASECEVTMQDNDINSHFHYDVNAFKKKILIFNNTLGKGVFKFTVNAINSEGSINYPNDCIKIYDSSNRSVELENLFSLNNSPRTNNEVSVYLPSNGQFYIEVKMPNTTYTDISFSITQDDDFYDLELTNKLEQDIYGELFSTTDIEKVKKVVISHKSLIVLDALMYSVLSQDISVFGLKERYNEQTNKYYLENILSGSITNSNRCPEFSLILEPGTYYFGYLGNEDKVTVSFALERVVNRENDIDNVLVTDPAINEGYELGSEVKFNNGTYGGNTITEGFTRCIYLRINFELLLPISRLEYDWYSSDENVAIVSNYGTVLAKQVSQDTEVTIYAIQKEDPRNVYRKTFVIKKETMDTQIEITSTANYSFSLENGTYKLGLNSTNSPYAWIQCYEWHIEKISDIEVSMDSWGQITSSGIGTVVIVGNYTLNSRVEIRILLTII